MAKSDKKKPIKKPSKPSKPVKTSGEGSGNPDKPPVNPPGGGG